MNIAIKQPRVMFMPVGCVDWCFLYFPGLTSGGQRGCRSSARRRLILKWFHRMKITKQTGCVWARRKGQILGVICAHFIRTLRALSPLDIDEEPPPLCAQPAACQDRSATPAKPTSLGRKMFGVWRSVCGDEMEPGSLTVGSYRLIIVIWLWSVQCSAGLFNVRENAVKCMNDLWRCS